MDNIDLTFTDEVLEYIVDKAIEFKLGARGLRSICEAVMIDAMFEMPSNELNEFTITSDYAKHKLEKVDMQILKASLRRFPVKAYSEFPSINKVGKICFKTPLLI